MHFIGNNNIILSKVGLLGSWILAELLVPVLVTELEGFNQYEF